jgi:signal transduction histidine kinase
VQRSLTEALEQQSAMAEILRIISTSPTNLQSVLDEVVKSAARFCAAPDASIFRLDGGNLRAEAHCGAVSQPLGFLVPLVRGTIAGRSVLERQAVAVTDLQVETEEYPEASALARQTGQQATLSVPLLREGTPIGVILLRRGEAVPFTGKQIALLKTFADQAVIAIENVRLFKELEARNHALTESLDQQTATSEILRVISSSPTDTQPVFDAIAESAARLCSANDAQVLRVDGDVLRLVAECGATSMPSVRQLTRGHLVGRAVIDRRTIHVQDLAQALAEYPESTAARYGVQSALAVPLLHEGVALGVIRISRTEIRPFTDKQIALLQTFADQAVIAIENVRLFKELETRNVDLTDALSRQTATSEILRVISGSPTDVQPVFDTIIKSAVTLCNGVFGSLDRFDGDLIYPVATHNYTPEALEAVQRIFPARPSRSLGVGRAILDRDIVHIADVELDPEYRAQNLAGTIGFRSGLFVPMLRDGVPIGVILVARAEPGSFSDNQIALLKTFADQAVIAIENVRLFKELQAANRELAAASHHKSEFLANMSHELRTPLNAIIGFSEVLSDRMFGDLNEKQEEYLKDIHASGTHLLSLINDILDLSKIEAGRMELELTDFDLPTALDNALMLVRERAQRRSLTLDTVVDAGVGQIQADERKIRQVVLNLLSNAIKFTTEGGRIELAAVPKDGCIEVSVSDTGIGIAQEDQETVFEEFRQVGTADKKAEGTGLGLTLCRKFIELHGGKIWVKSQLGAGSTFTFTIPVCSGH